MGVYIGGPTTIDDYSAMRGPCDEGFHVPTFGELDGLVTAFNSVSSGLSNFQNFFKIPIPGYRYYNDSNVRNVGYTAYYICCTQYQYNSGYSRALCLGSNSQYPISYAGSEKANGASIRPFYNGVAIPDSNWTTIYQSGSAGSFHNSTLGLISFTADGTTWYTIADKNVGATSVWTSGTPTATNGGKFYQRGNNYGFPFSGSVTNTTTKVNASTYGPGNYYSSSTFIKASGDWSNTTNSNLRGGVTGIQQKTIYPEMKNAYIGEYVPPIDTPGIYHNATLGLISLSSDGSNWLTIADKNLGATTVYNSGNTLSEANCGKFYQRGNNYGFPFTGATTTSSTQVNASIYGPGNYYSSSTFILRSSPGWDSSDNKDLRGGETGTVEAMKGPCDTGFHIPQPTEWTGIISACTSLGINLQGQFIQYLKIPKCGELDEFNGNYVYSGTEAVYWSCKVQTTGWRQCLQLENNQNASTTNRAATVGGNIRAFKNEPRPPYEGESGWTKLY